MSAVDDKPVLDIPDIVVLQYVTAEKLVEAFEQQWGARPGAVALPVTCSLGIPFDNPFVPPVGVHYAGRADEVFLADIARTFARMGLNIYLTIVPGLPFVRSDALHIVDITGDGSPHTCLGKSATQRVLARLAGEALARAQAACLDAAASAQGAGSVVGVVLDIVDLWPMGADGERIQLTCFCQECRTGLERASPMGRELVAAFERFPNPWNLLLRDTGTGIGNIDSVYWDDVPARILQLSHFKGFDAPLRREFGDDLTPQAVALHEYMKARHLHTVRAVTELFASVFEQSQPDAHPLQRAIAVEACPYDWTAGVFLSKLDDTSICDELWYDPSADAMITSQVRWRPYMWRRSRYFIDAFFEFWANCQNEEKRTVTAMAHLSDTAVRARLERRRRQMMAAGLTTQLDLFCLPEARDKQPAARASFVGVGLNDDVSRQLVGGVRPVSSTEEGRGELLDAERL